MAALNDDRVSNFLSGDSAIINLYGINLDAPSSQKKRF